MNVLEAAIAGAIDKIHSACAATGYFANAQTHEPKSQPGVDLTIALFLDSMLPVPDASGLASTTWRVVWTGRIYKPFTSQPEGMIDISIGMAAAAVIGALSGDIDLGGSVRNVDIFGAHGAPLGTRAGYQTIGGQGSGVTYRIKDITIPVIINDAIDQVM